MGERANYAITRQGRSELYYSPVGGPDVARLLYPGPEQAVELIRSAKIVDGLMDEVWAEGGILLDLDQDRLAFFQWNLVRRPELRKVLLPFIGANWPGWQIHWASGGIVEIADLLGIDSAPLRAEVVAPGSQFGLPDLKEPPEYYHCLITVRDARGIRDLGVSDGATNLLAMGPEMIDWLKDWPPADRADHEKMDALEEGFLLDVVRRQIFLQETVGCGHERCRSLLQSRWPGWSIEIHDEGLPGQWLRSGRDPADVSESEEGILREITTLVMDDKTFNPQRFLDHLAAQGEEIEHVHPDFLNVTLPSTRTDERAAMLARSIAEYRRTR